MNRLKYITVLFLFFGLHGNAQPVKYVTLVKEAEKQTLAMLQEIERIKMSGDNPQLVSPRTLEKGELRLVAAKDWTSGFFPGQLWFLYEMTGKEEWKTQAGIFTKNIEHQQYDPTTHDLGFKIYCSVGTGYRLTKNEEYKKIIIQAAATLSKRFNTNTGTIRSWDHMKRWDYPVIIDNMMNLELLFEATRLSGDSSFYHIAVAHANSTIKNHFRTDNSSWHVVDYDSVQAGNIIKKTTHQGFSDESAWARGQAWGLYGYTMCYRETKDIRYLQQAEKIACYILKNPNLPEDLVPYWDYAVAGMPNEPRDVSAAVITASALYELSLYSPCRKYYRAKAGKIIKNVTARYRAAPGSSKGFLLLHSTGNKPFKSETDVPLSYADYYYLEALIRGNRLKQNKPLF